MEGVAAVMKDEAGDRNGGFSTTAGPVLPCLVGVLHQGTAAANGLHTLLAAPRKEEAVVEPVVSDLAQTRGGPPPPPPASPSAAFVAGAATVEAAR
jgi:hypothetical protein